MAIDMSGLGVFKLDVSTGGALTTYSSHVRNVTPPDIQGNITAYHTIDSTAAKKNQGGYDATFSVEVARDPVASSLHSKLIAWGQETSPGARTFLIDAPDSTSGSERWTGECRLRSYVPASIVAGSSDAPFGTAVFECDGGYTHSVIA